MKLKERLEQFGHPVDDILQEVEQNLKVLLILMSLIVF